MGLFDGVGTAKASFAAQYERPGVYVEYITAVKEINTRVNGPALVLEKVVVAVLDDNSGLGHSEGQVISHIMLQKYDSFLGNVKAMIAGSDPDGGYMLPHSTVGRMVSKLYEQSTMRQMARQNGGSPRPSMGT